MNYQPPDPVCKFCGGDNCHGSCEDARAPAAKVSIDEQIAFATRMSTYCHDPELQRTFAAILHSLKSLRDQPDAGMREALQEAINLRIALYRNHEDHGSYKPAAQIIVEDRWLSRWAIVISNQSDPEMITEHHSGCAVYDITRPELGECNCALSQQPVEGRQFFGAARGASNKSAMRSLQQTENDHVAWLRYKSHDGGRTTIHLCDSDSPGAFQVYRALPAPVAQAAGEWVPVSERLPAKAGEYLCTFIGRDKGSVPVTGEVFWNGDEWIIGIGYHITAWRELPAPYRATAAAGGA